MLNINKRLNKARLKKVLKLLKEVNNYKDKIAALNDDELREMTNIFKERLKNGETLDSLLPEAFAVCREADKRVLGLFPYDVQVMGGIVLHQGNIAEMKTGEGKTLTATLPVYLNALTGDGVIVVTPNSYLAKRDGEEMGAVYRWLGLSVRVGIMEDDEEYKRQNNAELKKEIYDADIVNP